MDDLKAKIMDLYNNPEKLERLKAERKARAEKRFSDWENGTGKFSNKGEI